MKKRITPSKVKQQLQIYGMLLPNLLLFILLSVYPILWTFQFMFYSYGGLGTGDPTFVGLDNFKRIDVYKRQLPNCTTGLFL